MPNIHFHTLLLMCLALVVSLFVSCTSDDTVDAVPDSHKVTTDPIAIEFDNYVSRSVTRSKRIDNIQGLIDAGGFGVYAMYSSGTDTENGKYDNSAKSTTNCKVFNDNFMSNQLVNVTSPDAYNTTWTYTPLKYWPSTSSEYISFLAYAPRSDQFSTLYHFNQYGSDSNEGTTNNSNSDVRFSASTDSDLTFIRYDVNKDVTTTDEDAGAYADATKTVDLMFNTRNALNQYLRVNSNGTGYDKSDNFVSVGDEGYSGSTDILRQKMSFKHATARLAFAITSSALMDENNFTSDAEGATSDAKITVTRVILAGEAKNANDGTIHVVPGQDVGDGTNFDYAPRRPNFAPASPTTRAFKASKIYGAFIARGYLNLNNPSDGTNSGTNPTTMWAFQSSYNRVWFGFNGSHTGTDNTTVSEPETVTGTTVKSRTPDIWVQDKDDTNVETKSKEIQGKKTTSTNTDDGGSTTTTTTYSVNSIGNASDAYMFIIPQDFSSSSSSAGGGYIYDKNTQTLISGPGFIPSSASEKTLYCHIDYEVTYNSITTNNPGSLGSSSNPIKYSATGVISKNFEAGKAYLILIDIGGTSGSTTSFKPISFTVDSVDGWGDETSSSTSE